MLARINLLRLRVSAEIRAGSSGLGVRLCLSLSDCPYGIDRSILLVA